MKGFLRKGKPFLFSDTGERITQEIFYAVQIVTGTNL
jgi:hypothetical protein